MALAHIRTGDTVVVIAGKENGKRGKVQRLLKEKNRVVIERINMVKRHVKPSQKHPQGGVIEKEGALHMSNVSLYCGKCDAPRRARVKVDGDKKLRVCTKCGTKFES